MTSLYDVIRTVKSALVMTTEFSAPMLKSARIRAWYEVIIPYFRYCDIINCAYDIVATLSPDVCVVYSNSPTHSGYCAKLFVGLNHLGSKVQLHVMWRGVIVICFDVSYWWVVLKRLVAFSCGTVLRFDKGLLTFIVYIVQREVGSLIPNGTFCYVHWRRFPFHLFYTRIVTCVSGEKSKWKCTKWSFKDMLYLIVVYGEISSCTISVSFSAYSLPRKFLQTFSNVFQALLWIEFNFVLKSAAISWCHLRTNQNYFYLGVTYFGKFFYLR